MHCFDRNQRFLFSFLYFRSARALERIPIGLSSHGNLSIHSQVFSGAVKGSCPLLELPQAEVVLLDDWRPDSAILDVATTLLWFEGSKFLVCRPLNQFGSHKEFQRKRPTFLTCNIQSLHTPRGRWSESELSMLRNRFLVPDEKLLFFFGALFKHWD